MARLLPLLLTLAIVDTSLAADAERSGSGQAEADTSAVDGRANKDNEAESLEILGPGLGEFIFISGGEFTMGCKKGVDVDEKPEHLVRLSSFHVGRTPVTNSQFAHFLNDAQVNVNEYPISKVPYLHGVKHIDGKWRCDEPGTENAAACCGDWGLADRYCAWLSTKTGRKCRLPTEAEWEYACRGTEGRMFPWGSSMDRLKNKVPRWGRRKPPVGSVPEWATPEGVCDLVGYMDEACSDWYDPEYYAKSPRENPQGPSEPVVVNRGNPLKVSRGGLFHVWRGFLRDQPFGIRPNSYLPRGWSRDKTGTIPQATYGRIGFRVVVEAGKTDGKRGERKGDRRAY